MSRISGVESVIVRLVVWGLVGSGMWIRWNGRGRPRETVATHQPPPTYQIGSLSLNRPQRPLKMAAKVDSSVSLSSKRTPFIHFTSRDAVSPRGSWTRYFILCSTYSHPDD